MGANAYQAVFRWFNARPAARAALRAVSGGAVAGVYALYIGLLAWLAFTRQPLLLPMAGVPAAVFGLGTLLRRAINRPRPYEALGFAPLFPKDTRGQSFPSRHCFSAAGIAVSAWYFAPALAAVLAQPWADVVLCGAATTATLRSNLAAPEVPWDSAAAAALGALAEDSEQYWATRRALRWN